MLVNGAPGNLISIRDRGLLYGDGVFRTLLVSNGQPQHWPLHYCKLQQDCAVLGIACPDFDSLAAELSGLSDAHPDAVLKLIVTRGLSARGYAPVPSGHALTIKSLMSSPLTPGSLPHAGEKDVVSQRKSPVYAMPTHIWDVAPLPECPESYALQGVTLHLCELRLGHQPRLAGIKHLNRLENVLAAAEVADAGAAEGLLLDSDDHVIEGVRSNVFLISNGRVITPDLSRCGVAGVQRDRVIAYAGQQGMRIEVRDVELNELLSADEVFLTNSVFGLWSVSRFGQRCWMGFSHAEKIRAWLERSDHG
jgi:4-amino-4-deoxychorismate lyase